MIFSKQEVFNCAHLFSEKSNCLLEMEFGGPLQDAIIKTYKLAHPVFVAIIQCIYRRIPVPTVYLFRCLITYDNSRNTAHLILSST
jgi:hypothetical protein